METAPRNCRFLSLVVVELLLRFWCVKTAILGVKKKTNASFGVPRPEMPAKQIGLLTRIGIKLGRMSTKQRQNTKSGGHLKPVTLKPVIRIFRIFCVFASAFSAFSAFSALLLCGVSSNPCFCRVRGAFRIFRIFPYRVRIADFENPTDRLYCDQPALSDREKTNGSIFQKNLVSMKCLSAILGPEMAAPILWAPGKKTLFLQEKPCP